MSEIYTTTFEKQIQAWAEERITPKRIPHVRGVVETVDNLARLYAPEDMMRARLAGWIHDSAKHLSDEELLDIAEKYGWNITGSERQVPMLLHGVVGYLQASDLFGFDDPQIRSACAYHTTGSPDMNVLDKIVMIGDLIEPTRQYDGVDELRRLAESDLDTAVLKSVDATLIYLIKRGRMIDPRPLLLRNKLLAEGVLNK